MGQFVDSVYVGHGIANVLQWNRNFRIGQHPPITGIYLAGKVPFLDVRVVAGIMASPVCAQLADNSVATTTICDIVNNPSQYIGRTVEARAQIWPDYRYPNFYWLNESSVQFGKVCRFLQASFTAKSGLGGQQAFGTFRGRIVEKLSRQESSLLAPDPRGLPLIFLVDQQSDIHLRHDYLNGPIPILQLYDQQTASFVRTQ